MMIGDRVRVYPHGSPDQSAVGKIVMLGGNVSGNGCSIAITFDGVPPFAQARGGIALLPTDDTLAVAFVAFRYEVGPWIEVFGQGHYEIEQADAG